MQAVDPKTISVNDHVSVGGLSARRIQDDLAWGEGAIQPRTSGKAAEAQRALLDAVLQSIEPVSGSEMAYSACTDGRIPVRLLSGDPIPVREQLVGADMVSAFFVAESLGVSFYKDPKAPVRDRINEVADFLKDNGLVPSSHAACGAANGFVTILQNLLRFSADERFMARMRELLPAGIYDQTVCDELITGCRARLESEVYTGLSGQLFSGAALQAGGEGAIAELKDDGRGVHGHVEEQIIRVRLPGHAINEAKVAKLTGGREVFGVSDARIEKIARLFGRGNDTDYKKAYMALEAFADAGHGTLAKDLPTWIVTA